MDPKLFYGHTNHVRDIPTDNESDDPDLSDDEDQAPGRILVPETDDEDEPQDINQDENETISETDIESDDDDSDTPLSELAEKLNPGKWRTGKLIKDPDEIKFSGVQEMPRDFQNLETPYQFFKFLFTKEIISEITYQSNLYCSQKRIDRPVNISENDIEQFIGICIYMSIIRLPQVRHYWSPYLGHPMVSSVVTCNRWEEIKRFLHFNNNDNFIPRGKDGHDTLFKIAPLLKSIQERLSLIPVEENIAVDEQIIPTKSRSTIRQYNPKKPHKWGYKIFVLSGISGFSYNFYVFAGSQSNSVPEGAPDLGISSNVVVKLAQILPKHVNHKIFFDNWFTSVPLIVYLDPLGIVRLNRVPGCQMLPEKKLKKQGRGALQAKTAVKDDVKMSIVCWYDNKVVSTLSTYVGSQPTGIKQSFFRSEKCNKTIVCPQSILKYNEYMGGMDLLSNMLCLDFIVFTYDPRSGTSGYFSIC